jgi:hypothetical protein
MTDDTDDEEAFTEDENAMIRAEMRRLSPRARVRLAVQLATERARERAKAVRARKRAVAIAAAMRAVYEAAPPYYVVRRSAVVDCVARTIGCRVVNNAFRAEVVNVARAIGWDRVCIGGRMLFRGVKLQGVSLEEAHGSSELERWKGPNGGHRPTRIGKI